MITAPALRTLLRGSLIPIGLAAVSQGVRDLHGAIDERQTELAELDTACDERRRALTGDDPIPDFADQDQAAVDPVASTRSRRPLILGAAGLVVGYVAWRALDRVLQFAAMVAADAEQLGGQPAPPAEQHAGKLPEHHYQSGVRIDYGALSPELLAQTEPYEVVKHLTLPDDRGDAETSAGE